MRLTSLYGGSMHIGGIPRYAAGTSVSSNSNSNSNMSTGLIHNGRKIENVHQDFQGT